MRRSGRREAAPSAKPSRDFGRTCGPGLILDSGPQPVFGIVAKNWRSVADRLGKEWLRRAVPGLGGVWNELFGMFAWNLAAPQ